MISYTPNLKIPYPDSSELVANGPVDFSSLATIIDAGGSGPVVTRVLEGTLAARPSASSQVLGTFYRCTDVECAFLRNAASQWSYIPAGQSGPPIGSIAPYAGAADPIDPDGTTRWVICDGRAISRTIHAACFAVVGTTFGSGDGSTTFNIPDGRGRVAVGAGQGAGLSSRPLGTVSSTNPAATYPGEENHTLILSEMPSHSHTDPGHSHGISDSGHTHGVGSGNYFVETTTGIGEVYIPSPSGGTNMSLASNWGSSYSTGVGYASIHVDTGYANMGYTGGGAGHNNMQPYMAVNRIIRIL